MLGPQFHGTAHWFRPGQMVTPTVPATGREDHAAAWATSERSLAARYSAQKASTQAQPPLFSPFYSVETTSTQLRTHPRIPHTTGDQRGLRVLGLAGYADYTGQEM